MTTLFGTILGLGVSCVVSAFTPPIALVGAPRTFGLPFVGLIAVCSPAKIGFRRADLKYEPRGKLHVQKTVARENYRSAHDLTVSPTGQTHDP